MLRIAICDDIITELRHVVGLTNEYLATRNQSAHIREYSHPDALLTACEAETFHIFLLDMVMPMISGLELGRGIRRMNTDAQIIYITTEPGFALDAYSVNPLNYLLKPVDRGVFFAAMDLAAEKVGFGEETVVTVKTRDGLRTLSTDRVVLCEYMRHTVIYTIVSGEKVETSTISGSFAEHVAPLLSDRRFIQPHAAFVVNMHFVERLSKEGFSMKGGAFAPVSGKQFSTVRNAYMSYRLGGDVRLHLYDILRSIVTNAMFTMLLFTLARPKCRPQVRWVTLAAIVVFDLALNIVFYLRNDYTMLGKMDILFFILVGASVKPLFQEKLLQWLFNCLTAMNVYAATVIVSYYLCGLFPYPNYAVTVLRFLLFAAAISLFRKRLSPLYHQVAEQWSVYLLVAASLFMNFAWFFMASNDVERTLDEDVVPLLLLVLLMLLVYLAIFISLRKPLRGAALREENHKIQSGRELARQRLLLMDETVRQMSIVQHDRRHFNNTLLSLLKQGEADRAAELIRKQSEALPQKPQSYCQNVSVNAAVSYYAELAQQRGIRCALRLDIPEKLDIDELSLTMAVSNLMENAITAVSALPVEQRTLRFTAVNAGPLILELVNHYDGEVEMDENGFPISRQEGHGRGTQSVAKFVKDSGGELAYEVSNGIFKVRLMV